MKKGLIILVAAVLAAGCMASPPPHVFLVTPEMLEERQLETRRYDGIKEEELLAACSNLLQDLGFHLDNSESKLGVMTASKLRDARQAGEIILSIFVAALAGQPTPVSKDQTIRASLVVRPMLGSDGSALPDKFYVRVTFQRIVRRTDGSVYTETLKEPKLYEGFFDKLSKSVFIEGQKI